MQDDTKYCVRIFIESGENHYEKASVAISPLKELSNQELER